MTEKTAFRPKSTLPAVTPELLARAAEARKAKNAARRASALRRSFADAHIWEELAGERHVRLPPWGEPLTVSLMHRWLKRLGISLEAYRDWVGFNREQKWIDANSDWPARAWVGLLLERPAADYPTREAELVAP